MYCVNHREPICHYYYYYIILPSATRVPHIGDNFPEYVVIPVAFNKLKT